ncbi:MAG: hypothetical protein B7X00_01300 [Legionella sp. 21-45-4]|nr:MAG: hypothetical protein B7X00_01300 [Legionella sp. 21-45-4]
MYKKIDDFQLETTVRRLLYHDKRLSCATCLLDIAVFNGDLLIAGHVNTIALREEVYSRLTSSGLGYRRLFKRLSVDAAPANAVLDAWITTSINSQLVMDSEIDPHAFKILTSDQVVYLMGDVLPYQAERVVNLARNTDGVRYVVKLLRYFRVTESNP